MHINGVCYQAAVHVQGQEPLTASMLAAAPPQEQKQMLGELHTSQVPCMECVHMYILQV